ncbi:MAG TPA: helix-turn-helix domain-containing protein [Candidatus Limnocylindria bacterium]|nr:helix-turn-helix domain-containing protein [Candidatus Limnocylindria bacterium]
MKKRRRYRLGRRAERQADTHRRIVEAAVELHGSIGPNATTVTAIAERAGVERLTVYRHFPDRASLFAACSHHFLTLHPPPDLATWRGIADPAERCATALSAFYRHYAETESTTANILRDMTTSPEAQRRGPAALQAAIANDLLAAWRFTGARARIARAAIGHALSFYTWRSLVREQGLTNDEAVALMRRLIETS